MWFMRQLCLHLLYYIDVRNSKNCVTQYFALNDKILTLMDNLDKTN